VPKELMSIVNGAQAQFHLQGGGDGQRTQTGGEYRPDAPPVRFALLDFAVELPQFMGEHGP